MRIILSHPTGNTFVRANLGGLKKANMLEEFHTTIACFPNTLLDLISNIGALKELKRRQYHSELKSITYTYPFLELGRLGLGKYFKKLTEHERGIFCLDAIYKSLDLKVACAINNNKNINGVYAYEDGALYSFREAKKKGIECFYDLPIAFWKERKKLITEESIRLPLWRNTLGGGVNDSEEKLNRKSEELELSDVIIVPSEFVKNTLPTFDRPKRVIVAPFGSPTNYPKLPIEKNKNKPLRVLFAGSMGQRKGLGDLFDAFKLLNNKNIELIVMGIPIVPIHFYKNQYRQFIYESPRAHNEVLELMKSCDIFCLPSIVEGRALVMQEAMSQGLPLIITANTGGEDLIIEGETGFLVPIRNPEKIAEKLNWLYENRNELDRMSIMAQKHAMEYSWKKYSDLIIEGISN